MPSSDEVAAAYDDLAQTYEEIGEASPYNAHLEFPAMTDLLPDVTGAHVLDAGCGAGRYTEHLLDRGATVVGVDLSDAMINQARNRVGERATLHVADLNDELEFATSDEFDGIVSSLTLDYIEDWAGLFAEFARVVRPGGFLVFSVRHPLTTAPDSGEGSYFEVAPVEPDYEGGVPYYRRPLSAAFTPLLDAGFDIERLVEPQPTDDFQEAAPEAYEEATSEPVYLCIRASQTD